MSSASNSSRITSLFFIVLMVMSVINRAQAIDPPTDPQKPWRAIGKVTGKDGMPLAGVEVSASCGYGSLHCTGTTKTGADGKYELHFGPGIQTPKGSSSLQVATISAHLPGHFEANLNRQGDRSASLQELTADEIKNWSHDKNPVFLPGKPIELNFVMQPAAKVSGKLIDEQNQPLANYSISLVGPDLPPSSSVLCSTDADNQGRFTLNNIPTTFRFQFVVRKDHPQLPWDDSWASAALRFDPPESENLRASFGDREIRLQEFVLRVTGPGVYDRTATAVAANAGTLDLRALAADITQQKDKVLSAKLAVLSLCNSAKVDLKQSLIQESVPLPVSNSKFKLTRTPANAAGEFKIQFENPRGTELKSGSHQAIVKVSIGKPGTPEHSTLWKQLDIQSGRYELLVKIPAAQIDDSEVSIIFVTIQPNHDAWVKSFFHEGKGPPYSGIWTAEHATLRGIPVRK